MSGFTVFALIAGGCIAVQAAMNAQLGQLIGNSWLATSYAFFTSFVLVGVYVVMSDITSNNTWTSLEFSSVARSVPWYLWLSCIFSVIGVGSLYFLIPKMGVGNLMSISLTGQIVIAMVISHFGFFESPIREMSLSKLIGAVMLVSGIVLINRENTWI